MLFRSGIVYDAKKLLADVRQIVEDAKKKENFEILQPGIKSKTGRVGGAKE